jgi:adenosylcobinamide kinase/adenosylcobinamide-phosphate guanylyltransferase
MILLVTGGSGCGKSTWAEAQISALEGDQRVYLATMLARDGESLRRVARHRARCRHLGFETLECPVDIASAEIAPGSVVLLEDLVNLTANEMFDGGSPARIVPALQDLAARCSHLVMVTNDLFSDGGNYSPSVQEYLRCLADIHREAAGMADCMVEMVYSIPVVLKGELPCLCSVPC